MADDVTLRECAVAMLTRWMPVIEAVTAWHEQRGRAILEDPEVTDDEVLAWECVILRRVGAALAGEGENA